jgi:hypothetical protein
LEILIATSAQSIIGRLLRPPLPRQEEVENKEDEDVTDLEDTEVKDTSTKPAAVTSTLRCMWQVKHILFGIGLLATSWWQVRSGWERFELEFQSATSNRQYQ